jgi:hypothetical protein
MGNSLEADSLPSKNKPTDTLTLAQADLPPNFFNFGDNRGTPSYNPHDEMTSEKALTLYYGDMNFDANLARAGKDYDSLQINGMPAKAQLKTWADNRGLYFYFDGGLDGKSHHYIPEGLKSISLNGSRKDVDDMAVDTYLAMRNSDSNQLDFSPVNGQTNPLSYAFRMTKAPDDMLHRNLAALEQGIKDFPNNPYMHMRLADMLTWDAMTSIRDAAQAGATRLDLNNGFTMPKIEKAQNEARTAGELARQQGELLAEVQAQLRHNMLMQLPSSLQAESATPHQIGPSTVQPYKNPFQPQRRGG